ncbi:MAG TPA: MBOAT family O-acyltransferase [Bryobacteraceae bacterium]|nr:MBOAT family O-acyltransferase [Bryobacteraceae bacterium]
MNIAEFWRRWHITLSNWLRDYLYFSLPGLRSKWRLFTYMNLFVTMLLGGLWHGANWTFIIWGALHGGALAVQHGWRTARGNPRPPQQFWRRLGPSLLTAHFVTFAWIWFRASSIENANEVLGRIGSMSVAFDNISAGVVVVMAVALLGHFTPQKWSNWTAGRFADAPFYAQAAVLALLVMVIEYLSMTGAAPFLYTQF